MYKLVNFKTCEESGRYSARRPLTEQQIIKAAQSLIKKKYSQRKRVQLNNPDDTKKIVSVLLSNYEHEVFACIFLDTKHQVIAIEEMFRGTIDGASIHPREVVKRALQVNAAAIIFAHNHPSGNPEPSQSDIDITKQLIKALKLIDIRVLDHLIVGGNVSTSLVQLGHI